MSESATATYDLKSGTAKLLAVRRVTQDNQGKHTAGIDGIKSLTPRQRYALAEHLGKRPIGRPTRRVWIPKPGTDERRPLSIPTLHDRALQAFVKLLLEPEWEARFEPNRDGFRPGRSVHEAIGAIFIAIEKQPKYALDADIAKCFDRIDQDALLVRQYPASQYNTSRGRGFKTLITPSKAAVKGHWAKLSELISQNKAAKQANLIGVLNPVIAGWTNYYRAVVSTKTFQLLAHRLYEKLRRWAFFRHPRKGRRWVIHRYWETTPGQSWTSGTETGRHATNTGACRLFDTSMCKGRPAHLTGTGDTGRHGGANTQACRGDLRRF